jgi:hypothetical protein
MVEQGTHKPLVDGPIPFLATRHTTMDDGPSTMVFFLMALPRPTL